MIRSIPFIVLVASLTLTSALAVLAGWSSGAHVWILALGLAVGVALTLSQPRDWRRAFVGIFAVVGLPFLHFSRQLVGYPVQTLIDYAGE